MGNRNSTNVIVNKINLDDIKTDINRASKNSDIYLEYDFKFYSNITLAEKLLKSMMEIFRTPLFEVDKPRKLFIKLLNTKVFSNELKFIRSCYMFMEFCLSFQNFLYLEISNGNDTLFAFTKNNNNLKTHVFVLKFDPQEKKLNRIKEYYFLHKNLLETYYLNFITDEQLQYMLESISSLKNIENQAVMPKGFFMVIPTQELKDAKTLEDLYNIKENSRFVQKFLKLIEIFDLLAKRIYLLFISIKFGVDGNFTNKELLYVFLDELFKVSEKFKEFNLIITLGKDSDSFSNIKLFILKKFSAMQVIHRSNSIINLCYGSGVLQNYRLVIDHNTMRFFSMLYCLNKNKNWKKLYRRKSILLSIQKFFFLSFERLIEDNSMDMIFQK